MLMVRGISTLMKAGGQLVLRGNESSKVDPGVTRFHEGGFKRSKGETDKDLERQGHLSTAVQASAGSEGLCSPPEAAKLGGAIREG